MKLNDKRQIFDDLLIEYGFVFICAFVLIVNVAIAVLAFVSLMQVVMK